MSCAMLGSATGWRLHRQVFWEKNITAPAHAASWGEGQSEGRRVRHPAPICYFAAGEIWRGR
eukprot:2950790-Pyramimonas_sp.AAC.2